jgi:hypothetical protein
MKRNIQNNPLLSNHQNYNLVHVGGNDGATDSSNEYINNQSKIINNTYNNIPKSYKLPYNDMYKNPEVINVINNKNILSNNNQNNDPNMKEMDKQNQDRYDPITDYLTRNGLIDRNNNIKFNTYYLNINSNDRQKETIVKINNIFELDKNPLNFIEGESDETTKMCIYHENHNFQVNDRIYIQGINRRIEKIWTNPEINDDYPFTFTNGSEYLKITYINASEISEELYNGLNWSDYGSEADTRDLFIEIKNFKGILNSNFIGNIPITSLNTIHRIYLAPNEINAIFKRNTIYIKLDRPYQGPQNNVIFNTNGYQVTIEYFYTNGIPYNLIDNNLSSDIKDFFQFREYSIVTQVEQNKYYINVNHKRGSNLKFGGNNVSDANFIESIKGYPLPNQYQIRLGIAYYNVVEISLASSIFPNSGNSISILPEESQNNVFEWQYDFDGDNIRKIELIPGNYTIQNLKKTLEKLILLNSNDDDNDINSYLIRINIDTDTSIVVFSGYRKITIVKPFINITPDISNNIEPDKIKIKLKILNHNLKIGDKILIENAIEHKGIPDTKFNKEHKIISIEDKDNFIIEIRNINYLDNKNNTNGGNNVNILIPQKFRIFANNKNSICGILGFRNVGNALSITSFNSIITNADLYNPTRIILESGQLDDIIDNNNISSTKIPKFVNNAIMLNKENYILRDNNNYIFMLCKQINTILDNTDKIVNPLLDNPEYDILSKIHLDGRPNRYIYNSFTNTNKYLNNPIARLETLDLSFVSPNGLLYDFKGINHSFILKIVTLDEYPKGTQFSSRTGTLL